MGVVGLSGFAALGRADWFVTDSGMPAPARAVLTETVGELLVAGEGAGEGGGGNAGEGPGVVDGAEH